MVQRFYKIIVAFCLAACGPAVVAQDLSKKIPVVRTFTSGLLIKFSVHPDRSPGPGFIRQSPWRNQTNTMYMVNERKSGQGSVVLKNHAVTAGISNSFYTQNFGFMCKRELQLQKSTGMPVRFRLGSLEYSNALEKGRPGNKL